jgi:endonuclease/exonuclease/phosphatase family metal-dependent hydrolase
MKSRFLLSTIVILALSGCGKPPQPSNTPANTDGNSPAFPIATDKGAAASSESAISLAIAKPTDKNAAPSQLKIASYNIYWGNNDLPAMVETIRKADADLVCLQETSKGSEDFIVQSLDKEYPHIHFQGHRGKHLAERFGFLSRVPIDKFEFIPPSQGWFGFLTAEIQFDGRAVQVFTVHLQPVIFPENAKFLDVMSAISAAENIHRGEIDAIVKHLKKNIPILILGDFNSIATFQAPGVLKSKGFVDCFAETQENPEAFPSWHWPTKNGKMALRIDYLFHSPEFRSLESNVIQSEASDHFLIYSRLEWTVK